MQSEKLTHKIHKLSRMMHRARHHMHDERLKDLGFDPFRGQGRILRLLNLSDGLAQRDVAQLLDIRPQSLGELLNKLETGGFVERRSDEMDKRVQRVYLTAEGRRAAEILDEPAELEEVDPLSALSEDELAQLDSLLDKLLADLSERIGDEPEGQPGKFAHRPQDFPPPPPPHW